MEAASARVSSGPIEEATEIDLNAGGFRPVFVEGTSEVLTIQILRDMCQGEDGDMNPGPYRLVESGLDEEGRACVQVVIESGRGHSALSGSPVWTYYADSRGRLHKKL